MASDRAIRSLAALRNASSSRVLNLCNLSTARDAPKDILERPFFLSTNLNTTILLKHRLRANEIDLFPAPRSVATKVIIPFECSDLRIGGRSFFIGQIGFEELVQEVGNHKTPEALERDVALMDLIDQTPSLDPFMLRQKLRAHDYDPHPAYFSISAADLQRIQSYAVKELQQLTRLAQVAQGIGIVAAAAFQARGVQQHHFAVARRAEKRCGGVDGEAVAHHPVGEDGIGHFGQWRGPAVKRRHKDQGRDGIAAA